MTHPCDEWLAGGDLPEGDDVHLLGTLETEDPKLGHLLWEFAAFGDFSDRDLNQEMETTAQFVADDLDTLGCTCIELRIAIITGGRGRVRTGRGSVAQSRGPTFPVSRYDYGHLDPTCQRDRSYD